ncbi:hypothetical protein Lepto7375DRAFT_1832 [Leptolyngbya sp. PCC 7375]|nr:hypothetical protein Lepto7375DRAFT_1832 [Leptolyngbya sp. PCC 7375]
MLILSNRDVFVIGQIADGGINALAIWLKDKEISGTKQQLWDRLEQTIHSTVAIPPETAQVHTDILLPYVVTPTLED